MKKQTIFATLSAAALSAMAFNVVWFGGTDGIFSGIVPENLYSIAYGDDNATVVATTTDGATATFDTAALADVTFGESDGVIDIIFDGPDTKVYNPMAFQGIEVTNTDGLVTLTADTGVDVTCHVTGSTTSGGVKIYADAAVALTLQDASIVNPNGAAINIQGAKTNLTLKGSSSLADGSVYQTPEGEKEKGCLYSTKALTIKGNGTLNVAANYKHGIVSDKKLTLASGSIVVTSAASDALHGTGVVISGGSFSSSDTVGDGIDADTGELEITDGSIDVSIATADVKGLKADGNITISGGTINITNASDQGKGIKSKADIIINGGTITSVATGNAVVVDNDPSYCTVIKADGTFTMNGGEIKATCSGKGGKGISADGDATFNGGIVDISCSGNGEVYVNLEGANDTYSSTCITIDGNLSILGGTFTLANSGTAGKCIKCDLETVIGSADGNGPDITARTTGARILESQGTSTGGWGRPGGGFDDQADYSNPKVIKSQGNLTVNGGSLSLSSSQEGGEGLESKATLTVNGGTVDIKTSDDCINAASHIQINGGTVHCIATNNDAIDSNGTITVAGGTIIAIGYRAPECGIDCDNNRFTITGGTIFALGGDTSKPTASYCTQGVIIYSKSLSANTTLTLTDNSGSQMLSFTMPSGISTGSKMLISCPGLTKGSSVKLYTGGTLSGGTSDFELTTGASYATGTLAKSGTLSSMVTTF